MLSARSQLTKKDENIMSSGMNTISLQDKENTVSSNTVMAMSKTMPTKVIWLLIVTNKHNLLIWIMTVVVFVHFAFQPPSLNSTRVLASRTARKIFDDAEVSLLSKVIHI